MRNSATRKIFRVAQAAFAWVLFDHGYTLDIVRAVLSIQFGALPGGSPKKLDPSRRTVVCSIPYHPVLAQARFQAILKSELVRLQPELSSLNFQVDLRMAWKLMSPSALVMLNRN